VSLWLWLPIWGSWFVLGGVVLWRCHRLLRDLRDLDRRFQAIQQTLETHMQRLNEREGHE
jgi:hypothetical protein